VAALSITAGIGKQQWLCLWEGAKVHGEWERGISIRAMALPRLADRFPMQVT
jgi:hypothetical protein